MRRSVHRQPSDGVGPPAVVSLRPRVPSAGRRPAVALGRGGLGRRLLGDGPAKYDPQKPEFDLKLAGLIDARIMVESGDEAVLAGVPAERIDAVGKAAAPVFETIRKRNVRLVSL